MFSCTHTYVAAQKTLPVCSFQIGHKQYHLALDYYGLPSGSASESCPALFAQHQSAG